MNIIKITKIIGVILSIAILFFSYRCISYGLKGIKEKRILELTEKKIIEGKEATKIGKHYIFYGVFLLFLVFFVFYMIVSSKI